MSVCPYLSSRARTITNRYLLSPTPPAPQPHPLCAHLAFLYSGLSRRKSALHLIWIITASNAIVIFQWYFWGYSLAFSSTATNGYIGNLHNFGMQNVLAEPSPGSPLIPELLYSFYQMEFACVTVAILVGALAERGRVLPALVFIFFWMTIVYCPLACWAWAPKGWGFTWGVLDYAGTFILFLSPNTAQHGIQHRWWTSRNWIRYWWSCLLLGARSSHRTRAHQLPTSQCLTCRARHVHSLAWMARLQRRLCLWSEPPCCSCRLEQYDLRCLRRICLVLLGLQD